MAATKAHLDGNRRYLQKHLTKSIRIKKDQWQAVEARYKALGHSSFAGYVSALIAADMSGERTQDGHRAMQDQPMDGQTDLFERSD